MSIPGIGPHNGKELEMMLDGRKPLAIFSADYNMAPEDVGDADFAPYVESGRIIKFSMPYDDNMGETRFYCLPTEEWRAKLCMLTRQKNADPELRAIFSTDDLHRIDGTLLGYDKADIETFVERSRRLFGRAS